MNKGLEQQLIRRAQSGDDAAMAALVRAHQESLYAFMLRMTGRPDVAEDVVQEAFVRVLRNLDRFDMRYRFSTWLFTIAKRLYVNWNQKFRPVYESDLVGSRETAWDPPERLVAGRERHDRMREGLVDALASLGETQREIVLLFHQQGWSITDISQYLEMPEGTIKSHLHRARRRMRARIEVSSPNLQRIVETWQ
ncbi:MAG: RNA polymerase sigma factor [Phycisphaerales bacterium]